MTATPRKTMVIRSCSGASGSAQLQLHMAPKEKLCDQKFDLNAAHGLGRKVAAGPSNRITLSAALSTPPLQFLWTGTRRVRRASYNLCDVTTRCFATTVLDSTMLWG